MKTSPKFPGESPKNRTISEDAPAQTRQRQESFGAECEQELRDVIAYDILKKISRIHSVQFHNIVPEESLGKIISFKIE